MQSIAVAHGRRNTENRRRTLVQRVAWRLFLPPLWLSNGFLFLGIVLGVLYPAGLLTWGMYGAAVAIALGYGWVMQRSYRVTVLERSERGVVIWMRRKEKGEASALADGRPVGRPAD